MSFNHNFLLKAFVHKLIILSLFIATSFVTTDRVSAQFALNAENMGLGGGGTAYITSFEALHINPANLYIREKPYTIQFSVFQGGVYFDSLLPISNNRTRAKRFLITQKWQNLSLPIRSLSNSDRDNLVHRNFNDNQRLAEFINRGDIYWFGIKWIRPKRSYAISARTRFANRYNIGRGLFSAAPIDINGTSVLEQSFSHQSQVLHEISFGFAESFTFLNGLMPLLSEFAIGIAPKIVLAGSYQNVNYNNRYSLNPEDDSWTVSQDYIQHSTGEFTEHTDALSARYTNNSPILSTPKFNNLITPTGIGAGLDLGITYVLTFGDDLSVLRKQSEYTEKSLRLSLSVTDIGISFYSNDVRLYEGKRDSLSTSVSQLPLVSEYLYEGSANEHYRFLSQFSDFNALRITEKSEKTLGVLLPTALHAGAMFQNRRFKAMADISYSVVESAFNPSGIVGYLGVELRPLAFLPIRVGTRLAPKLPGYYSFGTGIETNKFDIYASMLLKSRSGGVTQEILGASFVGLKFHF